MYICMQNWNCNQLDFFQFAFCIYQLTPPPSPSNSGNLVIFFRTTNRRFVRMTEKSTIDFNNGCNDNYDSNDGNFDDNDDKKHTHIIGFE